MHYKTIVLHLIEERPQLHDRLKRERMLLPALNLYAGELRAGHQAWQEQLSRARPGSDPAQIAGEALEIALSELEGRLPPASAPAEDETLSLDEAVAYLRRHTAAG